MLAISQILFLLLFLLLSLPHSPPLAASSIFDEAQLHSRLFNPFDSDDDEPIDGRLDSFCLPKVKEMPPSLGPRHTLSFKPPLQHSHKEEVRHCTLFCPVYFLLSFLLRSPPPPHIPTHAVVASITIPYIIQPCFLPSFFHSLIHSFIHSIFLSFMITRITSSHLHTPTGHRPAKWFSIICETQRSAAPRIELLMAEFTVWTWKSDANKPAACPFEKMADLYEVETRIVKRDAIIRLCLFPSAIAKR